METALEEDVDVVGLSILSGADMTIFPRGASTCSKSATPATSWSSGEASPRGGRRLLEALGVAGIFGPGTPVADIVAFLSERFPGPPAPTA